MRAQRRYADMSVTSPSTAITDEQARLTKERDDYRTKLDARSSDVIAAKQAELESSYAQQKSELRQTGIRDYKVYVDGNFVLFGLKKGILIIQDPERIKKRCIS